jgi:hypothetical protein
MNWFRVVAAVVCLIFLSSLVMTPLEEGNVDVEDLTFPDFLRLLPTQLAHNPSPEMQKQPKTNPSKLQNNSSSIEDKAISICYRHRNNQKDKIPTSYLSKASLTASNKLKKFR